MRPSSVFASFSLAVTLSLAAAACGPSTPSHATGDCTDPNDLLVDPMNCGACGIVCTSDQTCSNGQCMTESCNPGDTRACYDGASGTEGVGPCAGGTQTCTPTGYWGLCEGEVLPQPEICGNNIDDNCSGQADEDVDLDGDGFTTCGGDCCDSTECSNPALVNPGAFEVPGNGVDDDCDGMVDNAAAANCDQGLTSSSSDPMDFAKAIDLCQTATMSDKKWGVISATWSLTNGSGTPDAQGHSIRPHFGTGIQPQSGAALAVISTGVAAAKGDSNPTYPGDGSESTSHGDSSPFPSDWIGANNNTLPNAPGCPSPTGSDANDPEMLTLKIRVPTNAQSFSLSSDFFSYEYPEYTCTQFNDFFVVLLDSGWTGDPANPADKNLAFYEASGGQRYPVGVNLAYGNTGLFTQCVNGTTGCFGFGSPTGTTSTCTATDQLAGTGFDVAASGECDSNSLAGGGTGWLTTQGNVVGGEIITLRIAIWDTSDDNLDSTAIIDNFQWSVNSSDPGTVVN
jgi:Putative metal-binding motif